MDTQHINPDVEIGFRVLHKESERYNIEFDLWKRMAAMVMSDMSVECGWKGRHRDMDFSDFSGYYMEYSDEKVSLWHNGVCEGKVFPSEDGVRLEGFSDITPEEDMQLRETCGLLCRSERNMALAINEMHQGNDVIAGISYRGAVVFGVNEHDDDLKAQLSSLYDNIRFAAPGKVMQMFNDFRMNHMSVGPEPVMPVLERCFFDGREVRMDSVFDPLDMRSTEQIAADGELMEEIREAFSAVRRELDAAVGVAPKHQPFLYGQSFFPTNYFRKDTLCLCNDYGRGCEGALMVRGGRIGLYEDFSFERASGAPEIQFSDVGSAVSHLRNALMKPENIENARKEYQMYARSLKHDGGIRR